MKPEDVYQYYGSTYKFQKATGMSCNSLMNWIKWGFVPEESQYKLERLTEGILKPGDFKIKKLFTPEEVAFGDLKSRMIRLILEFRNKYSHEGYNIYPKIGNIIIDVLTECLNELKKQFKDKN